VVLVSLYEPLCWGPLTFDLGSLPNSVVAVYDVGRYPSNKRERERKREREGEGEREREREREREGEGEREREIERERELSSSQFPGQCCPWS